METEGKKKEVRFDLYCSKCAHKNKAEDEKPCFVCLKRPYNTDSHKPIKFLKT